MLLLLSLLWIAYVILHSYLASIQAKTLAKQHFPRVFPYYRLFYNAVATILLLPLLFIVLRWPGDNLWQWQGLAQWLMNGLALLALTGIFYSMRYYDGGTFLGLKPNLQNHIGSADEPFTLSPLHRFVRHPWYALGLVVIWSRDMSSAWLISCLIMTAYFIIGSKLEDKKLIKEYGSQYQRYSERVNGIFPLPGKILSATEAKTIVQGEN